MSSSHRVRYDFADADVTRSPSTVNGELLGDIDEWGAEYQIESAGAETRKIPAPLHPGQRMVISLVVDGGDVTIAAPGSSTFNGTATTLTFDAVGDVICLESATVSPDTVEWRIAWNHGVALS